MAVILGMELRVAFYVSDASLIRLCVLRIYGKELRRVSRYDVNIGWVGRSSIRGF